MREADVEFFGSELEKVRAFPLPVIVLDMRGTSRE
jgi:hypothetical protein